MRYSTQIADLGSFADWFNFHIYTLSHLHITTFRFTCGDPKRFALPKNLRACGAGFCIHPLLRTSSQRCWMQKPSAFAEGFCCPTWIRTKTNRTKICRTTIILSGKKADWVEPLPLAFTKRSAKIRFDEKCSKKFFHSPFGKARLITLSKAHPQTIISFWSGLKFRKVRNGTKIEILIKPSLIPFRCLLIKIKTMNDQNANTQYQFSAFIDTADRNAVKYWTSKWNVSPQQLVGAVRATGSNSLVVVKEYLDNRKFKKKRPRYISQL